MRNKLITLLAVAVLIAWAGCGGGSTTPTNDDEETTGVGGGVSSTVLGSGDGTVGLFAGSANTSIASISKGSKAIQKSASYGGGTVTNFDVEIKSITFNQVGGETVPLDVNETIDLANPNYATTINFLASLTVPAGNYTGFDCELGTVSFDSEDISPDPKSDVEAFSDQTVSVDLNFSVATGGELALPLVLDLETILSDGFQMSAATPFAIRVTVLPLSDEEGSIWTTGDMLGYAGPMTDGTGDLYEIGDTVSHVGTYTAETDTSGTYVFDGGTYAGIQGRYVITPGGSFAGNAQGFFALNGNYDGGYWISDTGMYGTFSLIDGWIPNGAGTFEEANDSVSGAITLNSTATGGTWEVTSGGYEEIPTGTFSL